MILYVNQILNQTTNGDTPNTGRRHPQISPDMNGQNNVDSMQRSDNFHPFFADGEVPSTIKKVIIGFNFICSANTLL